MTATPPNRISLPPRPTHSDILGSSALDTDTPSPSPLRQASTSGTVPLPKARRWTNRQSFSTVGRGRRASGSGAVEDLIGEEEVLKLPTLVPGIRPAYSTPLPTLPMIVLCIAMLSELLAANLCTPFLLKMVEGFFLPGGKEKDSETEAQVGLWTGNLVSVFYITQFFTSLLWSSIADRHGRRAVLVASMLGSAIALVVFGTSASLPEAITIRLVQGIFGGAIGVFRGSIRDLTDDTNATRAYAVLGFSWGMGGVIGPILGGVFESPSQNYPGTFLGRIPLFQEFPYLLPTLMAAFILVVGSILACFLSWDGGIRGGSRIALPVEKNEPMAGTVRAASPSPDHRGQTPTLKGKKSAHLLSPSGGLDPESAANGAGYARRDSRASLGTAYGYGGVRSKHPTLAARSALDAARKASTVRRLSTATVRPGDEVSEEEGSGGLGLARKLLLANEENTFNLNDLWVSAAIAQEISVFDDEDEDDGANEDAVESTPMASPSPAQTPEERHSAHRFSSLRNRMTSGRLSVNHGGRRFSSSSGMMPAIFSNTGLATPPGLEGDGRSPTVSSPSDPFFPPQDRRPQTLGGLSAIAESRANVNEDSLLVSPAVEEKKPSAWKSLPMVIIIQYGLLALHDTTHGQLFLSFLVTPYKSGGIGLSPAHFSFLIAIMCLFQLYYQFYLYPRLGPPLGPLSHIQMFRLGSALYIPAYLLLPVLHAVATPDQDGGFVVMTLLTLITCVICMAHGGDAMLIEDAGLSDTPEVRLDTPPSWFLSSVELSLLFSPAADLSPPHVVGLANGLAQSTVSFARFFGPVLGGMLWSASINGNPAGFPKGFYIVALGAAVQFAGSFFIR
ncbi:hypothetical protein P7C73_g509, partial [Tremellales sp. Uapishka_1]